MMLQAGYFFFSCQVWAENLVLMSRATSASTPVGQAGSRFNFQVR